MNRQSDDDDDVPNAHDIIFDKEELLAMIQALPPLPKRGRNILDLTVHDDALYIKALRMLAMDACDDDVLKAMQRLHQEALADETSGLKSRHLHMACYQLAVEKIQEYVE